MSDSRFVFVTRRFRHHAGRSGYDRILEWIPGAVVDGATAARLGRFLPDRCFGGVRRSPRDELYGRASFLRELEAAIPFFFRGGRVFHFLYADNDLGLLPRLPNLRGHRLVATFHRPPSVLERLFPDSALLRALDRAIVLGSTQEAFLRARLPAERLRRIPHGVDVEYFCPDGGPRERFLLFVGHYLRDFEGLRDGLGLLQRRDPVRLVAVTRPSHLRQLQGLPGVEARAGVPDEELRRLYRRASALFLPLRDAVANNAILEAIACGLPVVTSDVGSVREYLEGSGSAIVPPGRPDLLAEAARRFLDDPLERERASAAGRRCAVERFDVRAIAARTLRVLEEVAARTGGEERPCAG